MIYDPIMEPLIQSSLAHFLYLKKNGMEMNDLNFYHPNYIRLSFLDNLVANKSSITLSYFRLYEFSPSTASIDREKFMFNIRKLLCNKTLMILVDSFVRKLQVDSDPLDRILEVVKKKWNPTRGLGILYFVLMDLYIEHVDLFIYETINKFELNCFWARSLNFGLLGFTNHKNFKENEILKLDHILPAWGLTAKVRSGSKGGRILRPLKGKLCINKEGLLQWDRPESIIDIQ